MPLNMSGMMAGIRTVIRGEVAGSVKLWVSLLISALIILGIMTVSGWNDNARSLLNSRQGRLRTLLVLSDEYKALSPSSAGPKNVDVAEVFAQVSENMSLGSRVNRITPDGRNQSVEINRLYAEELADLQKELLKRGVRFMAAEIRALPSGKERLFTVSAVIGPSNS